jgi:hypothetical protein
MMSPNDPVFVLDHSHPNDPVAACIAARLIFQLEGNDILLAIEHDVSAGLLGQFPVFFRYSVVSELALIAGYVELDPTFRAPFGESHFFPVAVMNPSAI